MRSGQPDEIRIEPEPAPRADVARLADTIEAADGAPPLSDQAFADLGAAEPAPPHGQALRAWRAFDATGALIGYAQVTDAALEIATAPEAADPLLDAVQRDDPGLPVWSHGRHSRLVPALRGRGYAPVRELRQLRAPLSELPEDPPLAPGIGVRAFVPGRDDAAWLAVNAAAFADHPEQGRWTEQDLQARVHESWFDAAGFLLAERDGELLGFHWTKVHGDGLGEVYVLGIAPAAQGLGLGGALLVRGLRHLADVRHCTTSMLYVEGDNEPALHLYERAGFTTFDLDVQWQLAP